jgi:hypothetical protein
MLISASYAAFWMSRTPGTDNVPLPATFERVLWQHTSLILDARMFRTCIAKFISISLNMSASCVTRV